MKCKTCGYDVKEPLTHCPMCGTRVSPDPLASAATTELSWNTKDFPKPKEMEDINMAWPEFNTTRNTASISEEAISAALEKKRPVTLMSEDASEGYVSIPDKKESRREPEPKPEPAPEKPKAAEPAQEQPYWYTQKFTATGVMQTGPAWPMAPGSPAQSYPATAKIETMTLSDPIPIVPGASGTQEGVNKSFTLSDLIKEAPKKPEDSMRPSGSGFYTFQRKNEEFQKLLDREYDRIHAMHGDDYDPLRGTVRPFSSDQPVKAKELSAFEKLLLDGEDQAAEETPAQRFFSQDPVQPAKAAAVQIPRDPELPDIEIPSGDPTKFDIKKIEDTIKELEAQEVIAEKNRSERKKRLADMAAAREAYFRSLDAIAAGQDPDKYVPPAPKKKEPEQAEKKAPASAPAARTSAAAASIVKSSAAPAARENADDSRLFESGSEEVAEPTREIPVGGIMEAISGEKTVKSAALAAGAAAVVTSEPFRTLVFKRISDDAEERAKRYEQKDPFAVEAPSEKVMTPDELEAELRRKPDDPFDKLMSDFRTTSRTTIAGAKDAERLAAKYDTGGKQKGAGAAEEVAESYEKDEPASEAPAEAAAAGSPAGEIAAVPAEEQPAQPQAAAEPQPEDNSYAPVEASAESPETEAPVSEKPAEESAEVPAAEGHPSEDAAEEPAAEISGILPEEPVKSAPAEPTQNFEPVSEDTSPLSFLYEEGAADQAEDDGQTEEDASEEESVSKHIILKIIIAILIICALFELVVLGMSRFLPDAQATQTIVSIEEVIREAIVSAFNSVVNAVKGLFGN